MTAIFDGPRIEPPAARRCLGADADRRAEGDRRWAARRWVGRAPLVERGAASDAIGLLVDGVGLGADVVTVSIGVGAVCGRWPAGSPRFLRRRSSAELITIEARGPGGRAVVTLSSDLSDDEAARRLEQVIGAAGR